MEVVVHSSSTIMLIKREYKRNKREMVNYNYSKKWEQ